MALGRLGHSLCGFSWWIPFVGSLGGFPLWVLLVDSFGEFLVNRLVDSLSEWSLWFDGRTLTQGRSQKSRTEKFTV